MSDIQIELLDEELQELYILAEELARVNFFIVRFDDFIFVGTYRNKEQMKDTLLKDKIRNISFWPNLYEVPKIDIQKTLDEFDKIYCPELRAEYTEICTLLRDLKIANLAGVSE